jgi:hypothetical protein
MTRVGKEMVGGDPRRKWKPVSLPSTAGSLPSPREPSFEFATFKDSHACSLARIGRPIIQEKRW